jgi:hypothetical protein
MRSIVDVKWLLCITLLAFLIPPTTLGAGSSISVNTQIVSTDTTARTDNPYLQKDIPEPWSKGTWITISAPKVIATSSNGLGSCIINILGKSGANNILQARTWTRKWHEYYGEKNILQNEIKVTGDITKTINPPVTPSSPSSPIRSGVANASRGLTTQQKRITITDTAIEYRYKVAGDGYRYCTSTGDLSAPVNSSDSTNIWIAPPGNIVQRINEINY